MFRALRSDNFPPFGKFELVLPPVENKPGELAEVHLFTGVNGTGKTRLLSVLAAFLGGPEAILRRVKSQGRSFEFIATRENLGMPAARARPAGERPLATRLRVANDALRFYAGSPETKVGADETTPAFAYSGGAYVADHPALGLAAVSPPERANCLAFSRPAADSARLIQAISNLTIASGVESRGRSSDGKAEGQESRATKQIRKIEAAVTDVTGRDFRFAFAVPDIALKVDWAGALMPFDALPDGLRSLIGWMVHAVIMMDLWLRGKADPTQAEGIFLLDEIETHLHPSWQRRILPAFQRLFPRSQIFIATHSPFVIMSLNHGWIHPLSMSPDGSVRFGTSLPATKGDSYMSVLDEIMGVKEWYDPETEALLARFRDLRERAFQGDAMAIQQARELAVEIGERGSELEFMMGRELQQLERRLAKRVAAA